MAEWQVETGIGEERALLVESGQALAARILWPGELVRGQVEDAVLIAKDKVSARGRVRFASGEEALVDRLDRSLSEGASIRIEVTRARIGEAGRTKLAHARPTDAPLRPSPGLVTALAGSAVPVKQVRRFAPGSWEDVWQDAWAGAVDFEGGTLTFSPTPAMTLIDVDGTKPPRDLALAAVPPLARAVELLDLAGSIGVDFPTLPAKADRKAVDAALAAAMAHLDFERTAMNGFGFVQLVGRLERPSLLHRLAMDRVGAAARIVLRRAEGVEGAGAVLLTAHPAVVRAIEGEWLDDLARRAGRSITLREDRSLAIESGFAQTLAS